MTPVFAQAAAESFTTLGELLKVAAGGSAVTIALVVVWVVFYWVDKQNQAFRELSARSEAKLAELAADHKEDMARCHAEHNARMNERDARHEAQIDRVTNTFQAQIEKLATAVVSVASEVKEFGYKLNAKERG